MIESTLMKLLNGYVKSIPAKRITLHLCYIILLNGNVESAPAKPIYGRILSGVQTIEKKCILFPESKDNLMCPEAPVPIVL